MRRYYSTAIPFNTDRITRALLTYVRYISPVKLKNTPLIEKGIAFKARGIVAHDRILNGL